MNEADFNTLKQNLGETEYLIEFQLKDLGKISAFRSAYADTNLPKTGPAVDVNLFKTLNAMTECIIAAIDIGDRLYKRIYPGYQRLERIMWSRDNNRRF